MTHVTALPVTTLADRAAIAVTGEDRVPFLQGLVSNDVAAAAPGRAVWAALLTPQGKWLADFFITADATADGGRLLLDCEAAQAAGLVTRLSRFRLRAKVAVAATDLVVQAGWDGPGPAGSAPDPRLPKAGWRLVTAEPGPDTATPADYDAHRLRLGLPDGSRDMEAEKTILLEAGFDELAGVSWSKGCYMGQELTARTKYRGLVKRRLVPVRVDGPLPAPGTPVMAAEREVGIMRSGRDERGLALLRLDAADGTALRCGDADLVAEPPGWFAPAPTRPVSVPG